MTAPVTGTIPHIPTTLTRQLGIRVPVICGPMYPCSNPELVAAASAAGGIGVVQPVSLTWVHKHDFREGLRLIRSITPNPIGLNALIEKSSERYRQRLEQWVEIALEEGVRFFVTSLGNPRWVVDRVGPAGGIVYHDVTERKWALKGRDGGVHGLIAVNRNAGGHAGARDPRALLDEVADLGLPVICAGGIGDAPQFVDALKTGYVGAQLGTRFIATPECFAHPDYKAAIVRARGGCGAHRAPDGCACRRAEEPVHRADRYPGWTVGPSVAQASSGKALDADGLHPSLRVVAAQVAQPVGGRP